MCHIYVFMNFYTRFWYILWILNFLQKIYHSVVLGPQFSIISSENAFELLVEKHDYLVCTNPDRWNNFSSKKSLNLIFEQNKLRQKMFTFSSVVPRVLNYYTYFMLNPSLNQPCITLEDWTCCLVDLNRECYVLIRRFV